MASQAGRGDPGEDRFWVCATDVGIRWTCDYGADRVPEESAFGDRAKDSVETADDVGAVGIGRLHSGASVRGLRAKCAGQLPDGDPLQNDDGSDGNQCVAGSIVFARIFDATTGGSVVLRHAGVRGGADTWMDTYAEGVLPGRFVCRTGRNGHFGGAGNGCDLGESASARGAGRCGGKLWREPGRSVPGCGDSRICGAQRIDADGG